MGVNVIRANYDDDKIVVYQAYNKAIAESAIQAQTFTSPPFKKERMTWIKPSFLWMMYRSGWGNKENQEHILAISITRNGFEWALKNSCLSHYDNGIYSSYDNWKSSLTRSPVRIQWDPEKNINLEAQSYRSIQIGLSGIAVEKYITDWIVHIKDITPLCKKIELLLQERNIQEAIKFLPEEKNYPLPEEIKLIINSN